MSYDGKRFRGRSNSSNGEVDAETIFHYHQRGSRLWGEYEGGAVARGQLLGRVHPDGSLEFCYHHEGTDGELRAGECRSVPTTDPDGRLVLKESWRWLTGDRSTGESEVEEIP